MRTLKPLMLGLCLAACGAAAAAPNTPTAESVVTAWPAVPDAILGRLRGGFDLGNLVAYFAIERVVEVNGEVVARAQIVISNLDRLATGGLPTVTVTGPLAQIIQIMNGRMGSNAVVASSGAPESAAAPTVAGAAPVAPSVGSGRTALGTPSTAGGAAVSSSAPPLATGSISSGGTQSGSIGQFGSALASAVAAAAGATSATGAGHAPAETPSASAASLARAPTAPSAAPAPVSVSASPAGSVAQPASSAPLVPTPIIVVNNLPNATAITTAVQNEVHATTIQTQTIISATLNSIPALNAVTLANAIQMQVASALGH
jgi:hypothetical protein